jgi:hypothetical protein
MGQKMDFPFVLDPAAPQDRDLFGLATIRFQKDLPPPARPGNAETQMVFGKFAPVVQGASPTGIQVLLSADGRKITIAPPDSASATYLREEVMKKPIPTLGATVVIEDYWPDFEMRDGKPATKSDQPLNPAALVRVQPASAETADKKPTLLLAPGPDGIRYQLLRDGATLAAGRANPGESFATGWADWTAQVVSFYPEANIITKMIPGPPLAKGDNGVPGFRARLVSPGMDDTEKRWVPSGEITSLTDGKNVVRIGYGLELRPVPFSIRLVNFEVPRYEGTDMPSNFIASVEFKEDGTGFTKNGTARMNHPASFPGTLFANFTGINYKFSQAEWNPRDLGETTLQVLYDPGWLLKWIGSLAICVGITIMFYGKPKTRTA